MLINQKSYLQGDILGKVDRASIAVSLETRVPLLTHALVKWSWSISLSYGRVQSAIKYRDLSERVSFVGFQEDVSSWMRAARLLVVPSLKEGCPTTVLEAMSHGVPVVAYNLDGLPELVRHGQDGLLVPAADTKCLAMAIIKLLRETDVANKMSASALARSKADFQLKTCVMKHRDALRLFMKG